MTKRLYISYEAGSSVISDREDMFLTFPFLTFNPSTCTKAKSLQRKAFPTSEKCKPELREAFPTSEKQKPAQRERFQTSTTYKSELREAFRTSAKAKPLLREGLSTSRKHKTHLREALHTSEKANPQPREAFQTSMKAKPDIREVFQTHKTEKIECQEAFHACIVPRPDFQIAPRSRRFAIGVLRSKKVACRQTRSQVAGHVLQKSASEEETGESLAQLPQFRYRHARRGRLARPLFRPQRDYESRPPLRSPRQRTGDNYGR